MPILRLFLCPLAGLYCGVFCFGFTLKLVSCRRQPPKICLLFCLSEVSCSKQQSNFCVQQIERQVDCSDSNSTEKREIIMFVVSFYSVASILKLLLP